MDERMQWSGLTALGLIAGLAIALPLGVPVFAVLGAMVGTPIVLGIIGLITGGAQATVIRRYRAPVFWWLLGSAAGMGIGLAIGVITVEQIARAIVGGPVNFRQVGVIPRALSFGSVGLMGGGGLGFLQWLVLRRLRTDCLSWITVNAASLGAGLAFGSLVADAAISRPGSLAGTGIMLAIASIAMGTLTAYKLKRILFARP